MNPFGTRARVQELALQLEGPPAAVPAGCPAALAQSLREVGSALAPAVAPRPEFRTALRTRLVAVASVQAATAAAAPRPAAVPTPVPAWLGGRRVRQVAGVAAGALASVVAVSGVAVASSSSLPGDPFYGVKRTTEALRMSTADGSMEQGGRHLELAATRLREVRGLTLGRSALASDANPTDAPAVDAPTAQRVRSTLADMDAETRAGSRLLTEAFRSSQEPAPLLALARFTSRQSSRLESLMPMLPAAAQDRARVSLTLLSGVSLEAGQLLDPALCAPACDPMSVPLVPSEEGATPQPSPAPTAAPSAGTSDAPAGAPAAPQSEPDAEPQPSAPRPGPASSPRSGPPSGPDVVVPKSSPLPLPQPARSPLPLPLPGLPDVDEPLEELLPRQDLAPALQVQPPAPPLR